MATNKLQRHILLLAILLPVSAVGQNTVTDKGGVSNQSVTCVQSDSLDIEFDITMSGRSVRSRKSLTYVPFISAEGREKELSPLMILGRRSWKDYQRAKSLRGYGLDNVYKAPEGRGEETFHYDSRVSFDEWMGGAAVCLSETDCNCSGSNGRNVRLLSTLPTMNSKVYEMKEGEAQLPEFQLAYAVPMPENVKMRSVKQESYLDYIVNRTEIDPTYMNNRQKLEAINGIVSDLNGSENVTIHHLTIEGYASPEGRLERNKYLSVGRAESLLAYILQRNPSLNRNMFTLKYSGENWDGLVAALDTVDMPWRKDVLDIVRSTSILGGREIKLMRLSGGSPYRWLHRHVFPYLRKSIIYVDYEVGAYEDKDLDEAFIKEPQNMSLEELYRLASMYEMGSAKQTEIFRVAALLYSDDDIVNLNNGIAALMTDNISLASSYLSKVKTKTPEFLNAYGVLLIKEHHALDEAKVAFTLAANQGLTEASYNLDILNTHIFTTTH